MEIMIVLVILGLLIGVLLPKLTGAGDKAKRQLTETKMKEIKLYIEQYRTQYNALPGRMEDLSGCPEKNPGCVPVASEEQLQDAWGNPFEYTTTNKGRTYQIKSLGADGLEGGSGVDFDVVVTGP